MVRHAVSENSLQGPKYCSWIRWTEFSSWEEKSKVTSQSEEEIAIIVATKCAEEHELM